MGIVLEANAVGEIVDDMVAGLCCSDCGMYFEEEHGYPVLCEECWRDWEPSERKDYQKAINKLIA